jgi:hypothetical protein
MASLLNNASLLLNPAGSIIAYEEDKIFSVLPSNGTGDFTFSGGDGGTRVNQQGYIEVTPANLILQSEAIGSSPWILNDTVITSNSTTAPNGTTTADTVANNGTNAVHRVYQGPFTGYGNPQTMSFSLYVKYNNHQYFSFGLTDDSLYRSQVVIDLLNGVITQNYVSTGGDTLTSTITNVGGGWYYVTGTFTYATSLIGGNAYFLCMLLNQSTFTSAGYVGTGTSVFVWGAMFNTGGLKPYQPTTDRLNYPRITYQNGRGALLSEPQRTNVTTNSQTIGAGTGTTVSLDSGISPDGTQNADKLIEDTSNGTHITGFGGSLGGSVDSSTFCVSIFAKAAERTRFIIFDNNQGAGAAINVFDLGNGTKISGNGTIENYGNGWYRCIIFPSKTNNTTDNIQIRLINTGTNDSYTGDGSSGIFFWGKQIEAGSFPTSYIPTTSATVTRPTDSTSNATSFQTSGVASNGAWSMILQGSEVTLTTQGFQFYSGGTYLGGHFGSTFIVINSSGGETYPFSLTQPRFKIGLSWNGTTLNIYQNGISVASTTNVLSAYNTFSGLLLYNGGGSKLSYPQSAVYSTALSTPQLAELTTIRSGSGGNISYYGPYTIHTFQGSGTFTPSFNGEVEVLVVAGGGAGGGQGGNDGSGGGGAGGLLYASSYGVSSGTGITVTIGAGGAGVSAATTGNNGSNSVFGGLTAIGGGGGGSEASEAARFGRPGGSGGGAGGYGSSYLGGAGITGQGNKGGDNKQTGGGGINYGGGGGGGAGAPGQDGNNTVVGQLGLGGDGLPYSISGFSTYYAGGGGCGGGYSAPGSAGGLGGGGKGGDSATSRAAGTSGVNYTGGGGGGAGGSVVGGSGNSGNGGAGVVIVRYLT